MNISALYMNGTQSKCQLFDLDLDIKQVKPSTNCYNPTNLEPSVHIHHPTPSPWHSAILLLWPESLTYCSCPEQAVVLLADDASLWDEISFFSILLFIYYNMYECICVYVLTFNLA